MPIETDTKPAQPDGDGLRPTLVLRFRASAGLDFKPRAERELGRRNIGNWKRVEEVAPGSTLRPSLWEPEIRLDDLKRLIGMALKEDPECEANELLNYFTLYCPGDADVPALLKEFGSWEPDVLEAYVPLRSSDPAVNYTDDPYVASQGYLDVAPNGVDAYDAWKQPGGDGASQELVDLEQGWKLDHEDLAGHFPSPASALLFGSNMSASVPHGTKTLGVICGLDNTVGIVGIAPNAAQVNLVSYSGNPHNIPKAILIGAIKLLHVPKFPALRRGGVLVLEVQLENLGGLITQLPCEADPLTRLCIRFVTALGVAVIEAAGNGNGDLDTYVNGAGHAVFNRNKPSFKESGAIMVASGWFVEAPARNPPYALTRRPGSNNGSRIDCHAWGEMVATTTFEVDPAGVVTLYTGGYNSTSSATAIVAGAALSVQGMAEAKLGLPFKPGKLREYLSEASSGGGLSNTPSLNPVADKIGVMPNLKAIRMNHIT